MATTNRNLKIAEKAVLIRQAAGLSSIGSTQAEICQHLHISPARLKTLMDSPEFKKVVGEIADDAVLPAIAQIKREFTYRIKEVLRVLDEKLSENSLEAAKMILTGILGQGNKAEEKAPTAINIVMPAGVADAVSVNAEYEVKDDTG